MVVNSYKNTKNLQVRGLSLKKFLYIDKIYAIIGANCSCYKGDYGIGLVFRINGVANGAAAIIRHVSYSFRLDSLYRLHRRGVAFARSQREDLRQNIIRLGTYSCNFRGV